MTPSNYAGSFRLFVRGGGRIGDSYYNALAETINGLYKAEVIYPSIRAAPGAASRRSSSPPSNAVDWFNNRRFLEPIGNIPPPKPRRAIMPKSPVTPWRPNSNKRPPGNTGQSIPLERPVLTEV